MIHRIFQVGYSIFFIIALLMLLVLPWPNGTAMYPFMILIICAWGFWYSGKKHKRNVGLPTLKSNNKQNINLKNNNSSKRQSKK